MHKPKFIKNGFVPPAPPLVIKSSWKIYFINTNGLTANIGSTSLTKNVRVSSPKSVRIVV